MYLAHIVWFEYIYSSSIYHDTLTSKPSANSQNCSLQTPSLYAAIRDGYAADTQQHVQRTSVVACPVHQTLPMLFEMLPDVCLTPFSSSLRPSSFVVPFLFFPSPFPCLLSSRIDGLHPCGVACGHHNCIKSCNKWFQFNTCHSSIYCDIAYQH